LKGKVAWHKTGVSPLKGITKSSKIEFLGAVN